MDSKINKIKKYMENPAVFLVVVSVFLLLCGMVVGLFSDNSGGKVATATDATATDATEIEEDSSEIESDTEDDYQATTEEVSEEGEELIASEDNYLDAIISVITGTYDEDTPITDECISSYVNDYFYPEDVNNITNIPDMCSFNEGDAVFNITFNTGITECYGVRFSLSVTGQINYIGIYYIPNSEGGEIEGGLYSAGEN